MARNIGMEPDAEVWRAVVTKTFRDGTTETVYEGPYDKAAKARGRVTFWRNWMADHHGGKAEGHVERAQPVWEKAPDPAPQRKAKQAATATFEPGDTPVDSTALRLVWIAVDNRDVTHGRHVADLLAKHGHSEEAERVTAELRARNGHLSARQALTFLEQRGSGAR
ncbi:hypothetical protein ACFC0S_16210 [Streptomyces sp. NPDC056084]|uniref:hypothetical protein n=1 Tax=unclassified Streptomyces TaxID=2593676 RepID=UPI0035DA17D3